LGQPWDQPVERRHASHVNGKSPGGSLSRSVLVREHDGNERLTVVPGAAQRLEADQRRHAFPAGPGSDNTNLFYANLHLHRRCFGWLYPLVEFNLNYHTTGVNFRLPTRRAFIDFDNFEATGNRLTLAAGANAVLIPGRMEVGAVYSTVIAAQHNFEVSGLLVKMMLRY
jgi:hypothetical protein